MNSKPREYHELVSPILRPARLVASRRARGLLFAEAHDLQTSRIYSTIREITVRDRRTTLAKSHVVFVRPAVVSVALDPNSDCWIRLKRFHLRIQQLKSCIRQLGAIELETDRSRDRAARLLASSLGPLRIGLCRSSGAVCFFTKLCPLKLRRIRCCAIRRSGCTRRRHRFVVRAAGGDCTHGDERHRSKDSVTHDYPIQCVRFTLMTTGPLKTLRFSRQFS